MNVGKKMMIGAGVTAALCIAAIGGIKAYSRQFFLPGTMICGVDVSGMTEPEAKDMVERAYTDGYSLAVSGRDNSLSYISGSDISYQVSADLTGLIEANA